jgi:hypothetical protein
MFNPNPYESPKLVSVLSNEEYLDAISAPRRDPTKPERKSMLSKWRSRDSEIEAAEDSDVMEIVEEKKPEVKGKEKEKAKRKPRVKKEKAAVGGVKEDVVTADD